MCGILSCQICLRSSPKTTRKVIDLRYSKQIIVACACTVNEFHQLRSSTSVKFSVSLEIFAPTTVCGVKSNMPRITKPKSNDVVGEKRPKRNAKRTDDESLEIVKRNSNRKTNNQKKSLNIQKTSTKASKGKFE